MEKMQQLSARCAVGLVCALFAPGVWAQDDATEAPSTDGEAAAMEDKSEEAAVSTNDVATDGKVKLGLRLGYGIPMGSLAEDADLSDQVSGMVPLWVDAGYMVTPNVMLGAYFQYGFGFAGDACPTGADCSVSDIRFGVQGQYHISPGQSTQPWVGLGVGYEIASSTAEAGGLELSTSVKGFEFLNLQGGADFKVADAMVVGPFASFSLGQFSSVSIEDESEDIEETAMHQWLVIGAKGTFSL